MGFLGDLFTSNESNIKDITVKDPRLIFTELLKATSGVSVARDVPFDIFYQIIAFQGVKEGVGCSTLVANTALAIANLGLNVCVIDTSILAPSQDILLKTNFKSGDKKDRVDWMDMRHTSKNVLNTSKLNNKIGVLSFQGRTIIDLLSSNDNGDIVDFALTQLHSKFDIILIDLCRESSSIATACLQQCHKVIQVWSNAPHVLSSIEQSITNNTICSCPLDKMRNVVTSMTCDDVPTDWDALMKQYKFRHLAHVGMSNDIARVIVTGKTVFNYPSKSEDIQEFNDCIADIVCHILNITLEIDTKHKGTFTANDIVDGKVDGTLTKELKRQEELMPPIIRTLDEADASLNENVEIDEIPREFSTRNDTSSEDNYIKTFSTEADDEESTDVEGESVVDLMSFDEVQKSYSSDPAPSKGKEKKKKKGLFGRNKGVDK